MALSLFELAVALLALGLGVYGVARLLAASRQSRYGRLLSIDSVERPATLLRSARWRLAGRPDEIRQLPDGRWVPIEWKSRSAPTRGPYRSHEVQVWAYLALLEETRGEASPYGVLRYGDGREYRIPWDEAARSELARLRGAMDRPYRGEHLASPAKCAGCRFRAICDVRA